MQLENQKLQVQFINFAKLKNRKLAHLQQERYEVLKEESEYYTIRELRDLVSSLRKMGIESMQSLQGSNKSNTPESMLTTPLRPTRDAKQLSELNAKWIDVTRQKPVYA